MSAIVIVALGSRGDVAPMTGLGVRLQAAGHDVTVIAYAPFADLITHCGLSFRGLPQEHDPAADVDPSTGLADFLSPRGMLATGRSVLDALRDEPADVVLLSPFAELAGHPFAEAREIPSMGVRLQPLSATSAYPPAVLGSWSAGALGNRLTADAGAWVIDRLYGRVVADLRSDLGLPRARALRHRRTKAQWPVLHGFSSHIVPRPADWRPGLEVTGYWWPAPSPSWRPPAELIDFLDAGPAPVFIGLGSTVTTTRQAERLADVVTRALRQAGARGVVQAGWAGLQVSGDDLLTIGEVPHDWLFPRMAAVAHHCGAGTAAAGLRAGIPAVALPGSAGDQPFWARRLHALGASSGTIPQRKLTADGLAAAIRVAVDDPRLRQSTRHLASRIAREDGTAQAVAAVEALIHSYEEVHDGH